MNENRMRTALGFSMRAGKCLSGRGAYICDSVECLNRAEKIRALERALEDGVREQLFPKDRPVYTKLKDCDPVQYGLHAKVKNSLVGDGAHVDGEVENCIIFRGAKISRKAKLKNCVIMQNVTVGDHCDLGCIIADKNVVIRNGCTLQGSESYPVYISKNSII